MSKTQKSNTVTVDIVSDIVCPWCWLGSRYFFTALGQSPYQVDVTWRPYMLDPTVPETGLPYPEYMKKKFGGGPSDRFKTMREHLEAAAPDAGINFKFSDIPMRPNTLNAHRLMRWATGQGKGNACSEALFAAFFNDLKDVGDTDVLKDIATQIGLDKNLVGDLLTSEKDKQAVQQEITYFQQLGISGVPCFIYGGQFVVQGAQPPETHLAAIKKAAKLPAQ